jgi:NAD(P)-dependent dehydrogenase (short-subunit alcohol dehydrogenase family)
MDTLNGKVAIVTGAAAGLGRAITEELAAAGAAVAVADVDAAAAERAVAELTERGRTARSYPTDVRVRKQVDGTFDAVARELGPIDIVVNNAGVSHVGPHTQDVTDEEWDASIGVLQTGVFYGMRAAARHMLPRGTGSVVNISSIRGFSPNPGRIAYCAAKAAVIIMTKVAAGEWASHGVRVNVVCPGVLRTPMWDADVARGVIDEQQYLDVVPMHRLGTPGEIGRAVVYLCSDAAAYVTGATLTIDGGLTSLPAG